jgi:hypothetical protein
MIYCDFFKCLRVKRFFMLCEWESGEEFADVDLVTELCFCRTMERLKSTEGCVAEASVIKVI